ncbi:MAG: winged helix-turn-helix transcriptional regulator [Chloroflexi bacterium]|nr:winged helix-turn-helix transcriptional regulator [Chloroflexota bacterium]
MAVPSNEELELLHRNICQAVGDPKRIQILYALHEQPRNVNALVEALNTPQPTISRHLAILRERGLVTAERDGTSVIYRVAEPRMIEILDVMRQMLRGLLEKQSSVVE